jgi:polyisoprenoid-binding protein YceI
MSKAKWIVDSAHSSLDFSIRHMMVTNVKGSFLDFEASITADPNDLTTAEILFNVDLSSVNTRNADRDTHLRTADFFDVEKYPTMTFKSTDIVKTGEGEYDVTGDLSLHGVTRKETFSVSFEGAGKDPWGNEKAGYSAKGTVKRSNYGLTYNAALEAGGFMVGDDVKFTVEIEASREEHSLAH